MKFRYNQFPRLYAAASLKHSFRVPFVNYAVEFPRLYAAASLKPRHLQGEHTMTLSFRGFMPRPH